MASWTFSSPWDKVVDGSRKTTSLRILKKNHKTNINVSPPRSTIASRDQFKSREMIPYG